MTVISTNKIILHFHDYCCCAKETMLQLISCGNYGRKVQLLAENVTNCTKYINNIVCPCKYSVTVCSVLIKQLGFHSATTRD